MIKKSTFLALLMGGWLLSCIEPYNLDVVSNRKILTIEATITDLNEEQTVAINEFINNNNSGYNTPVKKAVVEIIVDGKDRIPLTEKPAGGIYALPASFKLKYGSKYKLVFTKADGTKYESTEDAVTQVPKIDKIYDELNTKSIQSGEVNLPAHEIYIDTQDPADTRNNYIWTYKFWERQGICISCQDGRYFTTPAPLGACRLEPRYEGQTFDYECAGNCWDIFYSTELNVYNDIYSNGKLIKDKIAARIPFYQATGCLVEIKQQSVSEQAYRYLKLMVEQTQNTGSLADTPPAALIGNIRNINDGEESVAGFFMVASVYKVNYWLSRENALKYASPIGLLEGGRIMNLEPAAPPRPPQAPCVASRNRTPIRPDGWRN